MCPTASIVLNCQECGGQISATVYIIPGSLGKEYEYEMGYCNECHKSYEPSEVKALHEKEIQEYGSQYSTGNT